MNPTYVAINNVRQVLATAYTAGSGTLSVPDGAAWGSPSPSAPVVLTAFAASSPSTPLFNRLVTGRAGNVLTMGAVTWGTDANLAAGDLVMVTPCAEYFADLKAAVLTKSDDTHTHAGLAPAGGTTGHVLKKLSAADYDYAWQTDAGGVGSLDDLTDVTLGTPAAGEYLRYNGSTWVDASIQAADVTDFAAAADARIAAAVGVSVQAHDGDLAALAALTGTNTIYYRAAADTWSPVAIGSGLTFAGGTLSASGGGGSPGGSSGQVQYNNGGSFSGAAQVTISAAGNLVLPNSTTPGSPANGELWHGPQKIVSTYVNGVIHRLVGCLYSQTADGVMTGTTSETSIINTSGAVGTLTLPANFLVAGKTLRVTIAGTFSTGTTGGNSQLRLKLGTTTVFDSTNITMPNNQTNGGYQAEILLSCRSTGVTGSVRTMAAVVRSSGTPVNFSGGTYSATVDTTAAQTLDVLLQSNQSTTTVTITLVTVEVLN
jgi:hypothetical protein